MPRTLAIRVGLALFAVGSLVAYQIFGHVTSGMDAVDAIAAMPNSGSPNNQALQPVPMDSVTVSNP